MKKNGEDYNTESINITNCNFDQNSAFDGFAIYLNGQNSISNFNLNNNKFNGNSNEQI